jgi:transcription initiation factor TFIIIB Brf1 subunit/transcription initiation factor TFIIB
MDHEDDILKELMRELDEVQLQVGAPTFIEDYEPEEEQPTISRKKKTSHKNLCKDCDVELVNVDDLWRKCPKCGGRIKIFGGSTDHRDFSNQYNSISNAVVPAKVSGRGSGIKKVFMSTSVDTTSQRKIKIMQGLSSIAFKKGVSIPPVYISEAIVRYCGIKEKALLKDKKASCVFRGTGQRGILAVFTEQVCLENKMRIFPTDLAKAFDIDETQLSRAKRRVSNLVELGYAQSTVVEDKCRVTLAKFIKSLKIDEKYIDFLYALIQRAEQKNLHILVSSAEKTKCAGAIYILTHCDKEIYAKVKDRKIVRHCGVTIPTFMKYFNLLFNNKQALKKVFKKFRVPMPAKWKEHEQPCSTTGDSNQPSEDEDVEDDDESDEESESSSS